MIAANRSDNTQTMGAEGFHSGASPAACGGASPPACGGTSPPVCPYGFPVACSYDSPAVRSGASPAVSSRCLISVGVRIAFSALIILAVCSVLSLSACTVAGAESDSTAPVAASNESSLYGEFAYPENPVEELRAFLEYDSAERDVPLRLGCIRRFADTYCDRVEFEVGFTDGRAGSCIISFLMKGENTPYDFYSLDGRDNPSFTLAFSEPDEPADMILVLTSVILYLSPGSSPYEAKQIAEEQDRTLSIDGYSSPKDIGGYQIQARYTNPHIFFSTEGFEARSGVTVKALKQIWGGAIDTAQYKRLATAEEYQTMDVEENELLGDETYYLVCGDFTVKDWWDYSGPTHGDLPPKHIVAESPFGEDHMFLIKPSDTPYEVGIGKPYTFYILYNQSSIYGAATIVYAIQNEGRTS